MMMRRLSTAYALLAFRHHEDPLPRQVRPLLQEQGRFPSRRPWARRWAARPLSLPGLLGPFGRYVVAQVQPWARQGRAVAFARTSLETGGGVA